MIWLWPEMLENTSSHDSVWTDKDQEGHSSYCFSIKEQTPDVVPPALMQESNNLTKKLVHDSHGSSQSSHTFPGNSSQKSRLRALQQCKHVFGSWETQTHQTLVCNVTWSRLPHSKVWRPIWIFILYAVYTQKIDFTNSLCKMNLNPIPYQKKNEVH